jgi:CRISPR-associated endonuclease Csn1
MELIFGFDIGTTSIGFAAVEFDARNDKGRIIRIGSRIFPEARDVDGTPLNQTRRTKRMMRRQLRRRKARRQELNQALADAGLLPKHKSPEWEQIIQLDPLQLRSKALTEKLSPYELGRALSHLSKRRHFRGKDLEEAEDGTSVDGDGAPLSPSEIAELGIRQATIATLAATGETLGQHLAKRSKHERKRGVHALRSHVDREFQVVWAAQSAHHPDLLTEASKAHLHDIIFAQKPVFWRLNTLGECRLEPGAPLLGKGSWQSAQRRMLEKLNSLRIEGGNARPLTEAERAEILSKLQTQQAMTFPAIRKVLEPLFQAEGLSTKYIKFNLENGGEIKIPGNPIESKLAAIFGEAWEAHPQKQTIRETSYGRIGRADYGQIGEQRMVILRTAERAKSRAAAVAAFAKDFDLDETIASKLLELSFPTGWDAFSASAVAKLMPELERGVMMGQLLASPDWADWRNATFPHREQATGEILDRLPSPADKDERARQTRLRNPTVIRVQNELRKVVNNLIAFCGRKPDLIRLELARDVGLGKSEREEKSKGMRLAERRRAAARADLITKGFSEPAHRDIEKWLLWKECQEQCPYTGDSISFDALFRTSDFEVEHIWPRSRSLDDSQANKTLCRKDVNIAKGNRTPYEFYKANPDAWEDVKGRLWKMLAPKGKDGMTTGKIKRFLKEELPDDFASRQLNDTGYAARQAMEQLKRLWPDIGPTGKVYVQPVNGKVTAHLRKYWELNHILGDTGEKNRADHRHHAIDALVVACAHPGITQKLSAYWQAKDDPRAAGPEKPKLSPPWPTIRADAARAADEVIVSHRVRKKVSGPLHKETIYGDTGLDVTTKAKTYREFVRRKKVETLSLGEYEDIRDLHIRRVMKEWLRAKGGDPKKLNWSSYPRVTDNGPEIKSVRILVKQQISLMAQVSTGYADLGSNHHVAIYKRRNGKTEFEVVSLYEASKRKASRRPIVNRYREGCDFLMSLSQGDMIKFAKDKEVTIWRVQKIASKGQISLLHHNDASVKEFSLFEPMVGGIVTRDAVKVSLDPIGRVRPAND